jgi:hypothetical protein
MDDARHDPISLKAERRMAAEERAHIDGTFKKL